MVIATGLLPGAGCAHDYWIEPDASGYTLHQGHKHSRHTGDQSLDYDPTTVREAYCSDTRGRFQPTPVSGKPVRAAGECATVTFSIVTGYWTKTPWETVNRPRTEVKGALQSWYSEETVTLVQRWFAGAPASPLKGLQLTLSSDPSKLRSGDKFAVRALVNGKPQANIAVAYAGEPRGETDADGRINLRVRHGGMQIISASQETALTDGTADTLVRGATLNFVLP
jgi:nickel transport protein